jgi:hypothetical protein
MAEEDAMLKRYAKMGAVLAALVFGLVLTQAAAAAAASNQGGTSIGGNLFTP